MDTGMAEQTTNPEFDLEQFLPYLLNQAAEATSHSFQAVYRDLYGMTRTQWRVMANLGKFGSMTAKDICTISHVEKTKVSRAVTALESAGFLLRRPSEDDRRVEFLSLTEPGLAVFREIGQRANTYDAQLRAALGETVAQQLVKALERLKSRGV